MDYRNRRRGALSSTPECGDAHAAKTNVYGYLLATVNPGGKIPGTIEFKFEELSESQISDDVTQRFGKAAVHECFKGNLGGTFRLNKTDAGSGEMRL